MALTQEGKPSSSPTFVIKDNPNAFVKYCVVFNRQIEKMEQTPKQINLLIIPQCAVSGKRSRVLGLNEISNDKYSDIFHGLGKVINNDEMKQEMVQKYLPQQLNDLDDEMDDDCKLDHEQDLLDLNSSIINNKNIVDCKEIFDSNFMNSNDYYIPPHLAELLYNDDNNNKFVTKPIWDLQSYAKEIGFTENINYWHQSAKCDDNELNNQFNEMYETANENCNGYQHYLFVIDRRHPENLKHKNMHFVKPNYMKSSANWADKIHLFVGDQIYNNCEEKPKLRKKDESMIYSTDNLFPGNDSLKITDTLNGYKFILSYNLSTHHVSNKKWFIDGALNEFELSDMKYLLNQYFVKFDQVK